MKNKKKNPNRATGITGKHTHLYTHTHTIKFSKTHANKKLHMELI